MAGLGKSVQESVVQIQWEIEERETLRVDDNFERGKNRLCRRAYCIHTELNILFLEGKEKTEERKKPLVHPTTFLPNCIRVSASSASGRRIRRKKSGGKQLELEIRSLKIAVYHHQHHYYYPRHIFLLLKKKQ